MIKNFAFHEILYYAVRGARLLGSMPALYNYK